MQGAVEVDVGGGEGGERGGEEEEGRVWVWSGGGCGCGGGGEEEGEGGEGRGGIFYVRHVFFLMSPFYGASSLMCTP